MQEHTKRTDIEALRALAVGLVLLYHAQLPWFAGGFVGVDVFFVVSGFLITRSLVEEVERSGTIALGSFYARRARRLLPAAALVLVATAAAVRVLLPATTWRDFGGDVVASAAYVVNWRFAARAVDYLAEDVVASPVQHFWSLAIEEQFYLLWPVLLLAAGVLAHRSGRAVRPVAAAVLLLAVVAPSLWWSLASTASQPATAFFDTRTRLWELALGGLVGIVPAAAVTAARWHLPVRLGALLWVAAAGVLLDGSVPWPGSAALLVTVPTAVLLLLGGRTDDRLERLLALRPLQLVGGWSYSLYLWHWPPLAILAARDGGLATSTAVLVVLASVPVAALAARLVEDPVRFAAPLRRSVPLSLSLGLNLTAIGAVAGLVLVLLVPSDAGGTLVLDPLPEQAAVPPVPDPTAPPPSTDGTPDPATPDTAATPDAGATTPAVPVVEGPVGAGVLSPGLDDAALLASLAATSSITPSPVTAVDDLPRVYDDACHVPVTVDDVRTCEYGDPDGAFHLVLVGDSKAGQWGDVVEAVGTRQGWRLTYLLKSGCELSTAPPEADGEPLPSCAAWNEQVLARLLADPPDVLLASQVSSAALADGEPSGTAIVEGMVDSYTQLDEAGVRVVLLLDNPPPPPAVYECVQEQLRSLAACSFPRNDDGGGRQVQRRAAEASGLPVLDLTDLVCPTATCLPVVGNVLVYRQGSHLTATYAATMVDAFEERLLALVDGGDASA